MGEQRDDGKRGVSDGTGFTAEPQFAEVGPVEGGADGAKRGDLGREDQSLHRLVDTTQDDRNSVLLPIPRVIERVMWTAIVQCVLEGRQWGGASEMNILLRRFGSQ